MRDLYTIFEEMEKDSGSYRYNESEDSGLPFHKILEIVDQDEDSDYDDE